MKTTEICPFIFKHELPRIRTGIRGRACRHLILYPDTDEEHQAFSCWYRVCKEAQRLLGQPIHLSPILEQRASRDQKRRKIDLVDYYFETVRPASK